jgi:hypothetical protein
MRQVAETDSNVEEKLKALEEKYEDLEAKFKSLMEATTRFQDRRTLLPPPPPPPPFSPVRFEQVRLLAPVTVRVRVNGEQCVLISFQEPRGKSMGTQTDAADVRCPSQLSFEPNNESNKFH